MAFRLALVAAALILFDRSFLPAWGPLPVLLCLTPLFAALRGCGARRGLILGALYGLAAMGMTYAWVYAGLRTWMELNTVAALAAMSLFLAWHALPYAAFGALHGLRNGSEGLSDALGTAALFTALTAFHPKIFPGVQAHLLSPFPLFIQAADLGGLPMLQFLLALSSVLACTALRGLGPRRRFLIPAMACLMLLAVLAGYGSLRIEELHVLEAEAEKSLHVAAIQPDMPLPGHTADVPPEDSGNDMNTLVAMTRETLDKHPETELVLWPELPVWVSCDDALAPEGPALRAIQASEASLFMQCCATAGDVLDDGYYNVGLLTGRSRQPVFYHKRELVPFGEYLPLGKQLPKLHELLPGVKRYLSGTSTTPLDLGGGRLAIPAICYEACFPSHIAPFAAKGGNVIISIGDDAWFGRGRGAQLHFAAALFRAVEFRMPMVRATNSGVSGVVRATGEVVPGTVTPIFRRAVATASVALPETVPLFPGTGNLVAWGIAGVAALDLLALLLASRRRRGLR